MSFKRNAAVAGFPFALVNRSDGTAVTTGEATGFCTLDGGTQQALAGTPTHLGGGQWSVALSAAEMNADVVGLLLTHPLALPVHFTVRTVPRLADEVALAAAERAALADAVLGRDVAAVEADAPPHSLCYVVLAMSQASAAAHPGQLTVYRSDGQTEFVRKSLRTDAHALAVIGVE